VLLSNKNDIGEIDSKTEELAVTIRGIELAFKNYSNAAILEIKVIMDKHTPKLTRKETYASTSSDTIFTMEKNWGKLITDLQVHLNKLECCGKVRLFQ